MQQSTDGSTECLLSPYARVPLDHRRKQIRLLCLSPGRQQDRLSGILKVVALDEKPNFEALSYTWGISSIIPKPEIAINGNSPISLTDNLHNALKRLRRRFRSRVLWIDALCIDQNNTAERSQQVSYMGEIYKSAWRVCIWLGDAPDGSLATRMHQHMTPFWTFAFVYRKLRRRSPTWKDYVFRKLVVWCPRLLRTFGARAVCAALATALRDADPQWHTRLWVFQELNHAQTVLWCFGPVSKTLEARRFAEACRGAWRCSGSGYEHGSPASRLIDRFANALENILTQSWSNASVETGRLMRPTLLRNALSTLDLSAKDLRDRVFALRSVSRLEESSLIEPSYEKPVAQVYAEATYASIVGSGTFDIFRHIRVDILRLERLPSWAMDFSHVPWISWDYTDQMAMDMAIPSSAVKPLSTMQLSGSAKSLHLTAILFDNVVQSTALVSCEGERQHASELQEFYDHVAVSSLRNLKDTLKAFSQRYRDDMLGDRERVACTAYAHYVGTRRVIAHDWDDAPTVLDKMFADLFDDEYSSFRDPYLALELALRWWSAYVGPTPRRHDLDPNKFRLWQQLNGYLYYLRGISVQRGSLFTTEAGFLGLSAKDACKGDVVAIVYGCSMPLLLRLCKGDKYTFCGLAFVGGLLNGQLQSIWQANGIHAQTVILE